MAKYCYDYGDRTYLAVQRMKERKAVRNNNYEIAILKKLTNTRVGRYIDKMFETIEDADEWLRKEAEQHGWREY